MTFSQLLHDGRRVWWSSFSRIRLPSLVDIVQQLGKKSPESYKKRPLLGGKQRIFTDSLHEWQKTCAPSKKRPLLGGKRLMW